ncbi:MAG: hypothetical protein Q4D41_00025 [Prevotellaceae bacterium]|nr:hypothetical protein [Prevotellaceae bacterium]
MKKIYFILFALIVSINAFGAKEQLPLTNDGMNAGWGDATFDETTKTVTYVSAWTGKGWAWWNGGKDCSNYSKIVVTFDTSTDIEQLKLVVEYCDANGTNTGYSDSGMVNGSDGKLEVALDSELKSGILQVYIQNSTVGSVTLTDAYLESEDDGETVSNTVWEGEQRFDTWAGLSISASKFAGLTIDDKLVFTISELFDVPEQGWTYGGQILLKHADWSDMIVGDHIAITTPVPYDYIMELTEEAVTEATTNGVIIQGMGFTITKISIQKPATEINNVADNQSTIVRTEYYNMSGQRICTPQKGINIIKNVLSNGNTISKKVVLR